MISPELGQTDRSPLQKAREMGEFEPCVVLAIHEMDENRVYMRELLESIYSDARLGKWSAIISDDKSGRLPALVIKEAIKAWGFGELPLIGIDGATLESYLDAAAPPITQQLPQGRALVVTEAVFSGRSIERIQDHVKQEIDVAALALFHHESTRQFIRFSNFSWYTSSFIFTGIVDYIPFHSQNSFVDNEFLEKYLGIVDSSDECGYVSVEPWRKELIDYLILEYGRELAQEVLLRCAPADLGAAGETSA